VNSGADFDPDNCVPTPGSFILRVAGTPHYDGVIAGGSEPAVIAMCHLQTKAEQQPYFIAAATLAVGGSLIPVPIGVLVQDEQKRTIGAVGMTGDTSDNDEAAAFAGLAAANRI
jgi:uncharacterized protein GlcG (DUF336 family)